MKHLETDVVVVGCGVAGLSSALTALEKGARVILLERATKDQRGGNTRWTSANLRVESDGEVMNNFESGYRRNRGYHLVPEFEKAAEQDYEKWPDLVKAMAFVDPILLKAFVSSVPAGLKWLREYGVTIHDNIYPYIPLAPHIAINGGGLAIVESLAPAIEQKGGLILYQTTAVKLLQDDDNRVVGIKATDEHGDSVVINAQSVVLASGGFQGNPEMLAKYIGPNARYSRPVARGGWYNKGEGIEMALAISAAPAGDYADCHRQPIDPRSSVAEPLVHAIPLGIVVNKEGQRFFDEACSDIRFYQEEPNILINKQRDGIAYLIYDQRTDTIPGWRQSIQSDQPPITAETLPELASKLGISCSALMKTVADFNHSCSCDDPIDISDFDDKGTNGVVPAKTNFARPISRGPFGAYPIIAAITFTYGALRINKDGQVISKSGVPIRGLYAAGETAGIIYGTYVGATSVLRGLVFGRAAGSHAAGNLVNRS
jgi:tricarballylate dehydrogenase